MEFSKNQLRVMATVASCSLVAAGYIGYMLHKIVASKNSRNRKEEHNHQQSEESEIVEEPDEAGYYLKDNKTKPPVEDKSKVHFEKRSVFKSYDDESGDPVDRYVVNQSLREPVVLKELRMYTRENVEIPECLTDPIEAQFFRLLLNMLNAKKCLEIGMYTGYNTLSCALTIPPDGIVYALEINQKFINVAQRFFKKAEVDDRIEILSGDAVDAMDRLIQENHAGTFDFIYVDADKHDYDKYLEKGLELLRYGGVIALDNTLYQGLVVEFDERADKVLLDRAKALHELNKKIKMDDRFQLSLLKIADGVTICRKIV